MTAALPSPTGDTEYARLEHVVAELKRREALYIRAISELLLAPTVVRADVVDGYWQAVMSNGERWRCIPVAKRSQHEPSHEWVLTQAPVPTGRAGIREDLMNDLAKVSPLTLMPRGAA